MEKIQDDKKHSQASENSGSDDDAGKSTTIDDVEVDNFYGSSTTKAYRLKSALVGKCMEEIGMGWYSFLAIFVFSRC
jgi:hypothetical protein